MIILKLPICMMIILEFLIHVIYETRQGALSFSKAHYLPTTEQSAARSVKFNFGGKLMFIMFFHSKESSIIHTVTF